MRFKLDIFIFLVSITPSLVKYKWDPYLPLAY